MARGHHPNFVRGAAALGEPRLRAIAGRASVAVAAKLTAEQLAAELLRALPDANDVWPLLETGDLEPIGVALGLGVRARWRSKLSAAEFEALPFYRKPSYDQDVLNVLLASGPAPEPQPRAVARRRLSKAWPELATLAAWAKADRKAIARRLAKAMPGCAAGKPALVGERELVHLRHGKLGVDFVVVPGGKLAMGLAATEQRELTKLAHAAGEDAMRGAKELATAARPAHDVKVAGFAVAVAPLTRAQLGALGAEVVDEMPGDAARAYGPGAARAVATAKLRLLSEAEWEWVARAGGTRAWLSGDRAPAAWAERRTQGLADVHPFGVDQLGWGEWVDDGWHASYRGAPAVSAAWTPCEWPVVARGGALALWPWQTGELVMCHAAARMRDSNGAHCVRLVMDLPG
jgi:formylglycine-generating enzyme required for sulfatase activity